MPIKTGLRPEMRKGRTIPADVRPSSRLLAGCDCPSTAKTLQIQCLVRGFGLQPTLATDVAEMFFGPSSE